MINRIIIALLLILVSSCGIIIEVQDTDDMYFSGHRDVPRTRVKFNNYVPYSSYYYFNPIVGYTNMYQTWFVRPQIGVTIIEAPKYQYGKRPTREEHRSDNIRGGRKPN